MYVSATTSKHKSHYDLHITSVEMPMEMHHHCPLKSSMIKQELISPALESIPQSTQPSHWSKFSRANYYGYKQELHTCTLIFTWFSCIPSSPHNHFWLLACKCLITPLYSGQNKVTFAVLTINRQTSSKSECIIRIAYKFRNSQCIKISNAACICSCSI